MSIFLVMCLFPTSVFLTNRPYLRSSLLRQSFATLNILCHLSIHSFTGNFLFEDMIMNKIQSCSWRHYSLMGEDAYESASVEICAVSGEESKWNDVTVSGTETPQEELLLLGNFSLTNESWKICKYFLNKYDTKKGWKGKATFQWADR